MSTFLNTRRRRIYAKGTSIVLRRQTYPLTTPVTFTIVALRGAYMNYSPEQLVGGIQQGDALLSILNDEITAAAWPGPPKRQDSVLILNAPWFIQGVFPILDADLLIGFDLWIRGGP